MVLWAEPGRETSNITNLESMPSLYGEPIFQKTRRFVVVRDCSNYCTALPITTYGGQGVAKRGVNKSEHCVVYTGKTAPQVHSSEAPQRGEEGLQAESIRVVTDSRIDALDPMSRLDLGKPYTIEHNVKVKPLGMVHEKSIDAMTILFLSVMTKSS